LQEYLFRVLLVYVHTKIRFNS